MKMEALPNRIDKHVGNRVRMRRMMLNMSQSDIGGALGISFQQIQKYEKGTNRISASRLQQISKVLQVPVPFFFEGLASLESHPKSVLQAQIPDDITELLATRDGLALAKAFGRIKNAGVRRQIVGLVEDIAARSKEGWAR
jgi:transcriptional regulator with XRE-family HTH domain